jgi:hypothetical protein
MTPLRRATLISAAPGAVELQLDLQWRGRVSLVDGHTGRITLLPPQGFREPRTWALDPSGAYPLEGCRRDAIHAPDALATVAQDGDAWLLTGSHLRARIVLDPFAVTWQQLDATDAWQTCAADRAHSYAYAVSERSSTLWHWQQRAPAHDRYFGLGDKTGELDLHGRRLRTRQLDALGYDAKTGDPLYKHWPFSCSTAHRTAARAACTTTRSLNARSTSAPSTTTTTAATAPPRSPTATSISTSSPGRRCVSRSRVSSPPSAALRCRRAGRWATPTPQSA